MAAISLFTTCRETPGTFNQDSSYVTDSLHPVGAFENSEFTFLNIPSTITHIDTSPGWNQDGEKLLIAGTVFQSDGKTTASDILIYYYHTNTAGRYIHKPEIKRSMPPNPLGQTHGYIRGWVKTNASGQYYIYTVRPGTYPTNDEPAHIHLTIKEPNNKPEYYIDDIMFDDDPLLVSSKRSKLEHRGGTGITDLKVSEGIHTGTRDITLGLNIPGY